MYLFVVDGFGQRGKESSVLGMPDKTTYSAGVDSNLRKMGISGGASQVPAMALPHEEDARREFAYTNRFDFTAKGVVALIVIIGAAIAGLFVLRSTYWYVGLVILAVDALMLFGPFYVNPRPRARRRDSND